MSDAVLTLNEIRQIVQPLAQKYQVKEVYVFGSYARNEATALSDIDLLVFGREGFKLTTFFAFAEELRMVIKKEIDIFETNEVDQNSFFYNTIKKEMVKVA